jgi:hypothetical protein
MVPMGQLGAAGEEIKIFCIFFSKKKSSLLSTSACL